MRSLVALVVVAACSGGAPSKRTVASSSSNAAEPQPPVAARRPHEVSAPGGTRDDPYYWLRDDKRADKDVLAYLAAENAYTAAVLAPVKSLEDQLFTEFRSRIKEDDASVPTFEDGYWYYTRFETGKQQPVYARRKGTMDAAEEVLLDANQLGAGHDFYRVGAYRVSPNGTMLAWADDVVGRNQYALHIKNLATGEVLKDTATNMNPSLAWANDNKTLFYIGKDPTTLREDRVFRQVVGGGPPELAFKEDDGSYYVSVQNLKSKRYIAIALRATTNTEVRLIDANAPATPPRVAIPREKDHLYDLDHLDGKFVIRTNAGAKNFRIVEVPEAKVADRSAWKELVPHRADALVEDFALYHGFVAVTVRTGGLRKVQVLPAHGAPYYIDANDPSYAMTVIDTPDPDAKRVRYTYDSLVTPDSTYEADVTTKERVLLKQQPVPGYDASQYATEYLHATASDGTAIPVSVVYKKTTKRDGTAPLLVYGYGSYGFSQNPSFSAPTVSLLDRGWIYAIAHVRGGQEMGRAWYDDGHLMHKKNTFTDFIAATEYLVAQKYGARGQAFALGGSAGGLLMGAILNLRPDLYRGVAAIVPFVDVVTTMLDESIPLTTNEFDEWGNPKEKAAYDYMLSYSPYDNVKAQAYPAIYVHTGLWDSQVQYFEPTKWVAKLRATKIDHNPLVLDIDMTSGHGGASGRFDRLRQTARVYAFMLHVHDQPDPRGTPQAH